MWGWGRQKRGKVVVRGVVREAVRGNKRSPSHPPPLLGERRKAGYTCRKARRREGEHREGCRVGNCGGARHQRKARAGGNAAEGRNGYGAAVMPC